MLDEISRQERRVAEIMEDGIGEYQAAFELEVKEAGERLYRHLLAHPVTLNSLRAARVTADAAAVALAVKSGGIGLHDLILTPVMLSFTSLLAEGAMGGYMRQVEKELKQTRLKMIDEILLQGLLKWHLLALPAGMECRGCYRISGTALAEAEQALEALGS